MHCFSLLQCGVKKNPHGQNRNKGKGGEDWLDKLDSYYLWRYTNMSSLFGFMSSGSDKPEESSATMENAPVAEEPPASSGFGFLSSPTSPTPTPNSAAVEPAVNVKSPTVIKTAPEVVNSPVVQDVVFERRATSGAVVKKKKKTIVGRGREENDGSDMVSATSPPVPSSSLQPRNEVHETTLTTSDRGGSMSTDTLQTGGTSSNDSSSGNNERGGFVDLGINSPAGTPPRSHSPEPITNTRSSSSTLELDTHAPPPPEQPTTPKVAPPAIPPRSETMDGEDEVSVDNSRTSSSSRAAPPAQPTSLPPSFQQQQQEVTAASQPAALIFEEKCNSLRKRADNEVSVFQQSSTTIQECITTITTRQSEIKLKLWTAEKELDTYRGEISNAEREQERLAAEEDFEKAHCLGESIAILINRVSDAQELITSLGEENLLLTARLEENISKLAPVLGGLMGCLRDTVQQQTEERKRMDMEVSTQCSAEKDRLETEVARLALKQDKVRRDEERLSEESFVVETEISSQLGDVNERRSGLEAQRFGLQSEIADLEKQLALKKQQEVDVNIGIGELDGQILTVRSGFERQLLLLKERRVRIESTSAECEADAADITRDEQRLQTEELHVSTLRNDSDAWSEALEGDLSIARVLQAAELMTPTLLSATSTSTPASTSASTEQSNEESLNSLRSQLGTASRELNNEVEVLSKKQETLDALDNEIRDIEEKLPKLDVEKKAHAAARKFKDAAATVKEQEALQSLKEEKSQSALIIIADIESGRELVRSATERRDSALRALQDTQRRTDVTRYSLLCKQERYITTILQKVENVMASMASSNDSRWELKIRIPAQQLLQATLGGVVTEKNAIAAIHSLTVEEVRNASHDDDQEEEQEEEEEGGEKKKGISAAKEHQGDADADAKMETDQEVETIDNEGSVSCTLSKSDQAAAAAASTRIENIRLAMELLSNVDDVMKRIDEAAAAEDFEQAAALDDELAAEDGKLQALLSKMNITTDELRVEAAASISAEVEVEAP